MIRQMIPLVPPKRVLVTWDYQRLDEKQSQLEVYLLDNETNTSKSTRKYLQDMVELIRETKVNLLLNKQGASLTDIDKD